MRPGQSAADWAAEQAELRAAYQRRNDEERAMRAAYRANRKDQHQGFFCPECGVYRQTLETVRVHRWLAHDVQEKVA